MIFGWGRNHVRLIAKSENDLRRLSQYQRKVFRLALRKVPGDIAGTKASKLRPGIPAPEFKSESLNHLQVWLRKLFPILERCFETVLIKGRCVIVETGFP